MLNAVLQTRHAEPLNKRVGLKMLATVREIEDRAPMCASMIVNGGSTPNVWNASKSRHAGLALREFRAQ
jgi:hypothetical protein